VIERIRSLIMDPIAHLVPFNTPTREKELALRLGLPMYGRRSEILRWHKERLAGEIFSEKMFRTS